MAFVLDAYLGGRARDRGQSALQHRRAGAQPVVSGTAVADFQLDCLTLLPVPVPAACSREARECSFSEFPIRLSPNLRGLVHPPARAHHRAGARAAVFFFPTIPPSISVCRESWLRYPLLNTPQFIDLLIL